MNSGHIYVHNPLPATMHHYVSTLEEMLKALGHDVSHAVATSVEVQSSREPKLGVAIRSLLGRLRMLRKPPGLIVDVWPSFGLLECLAWSIVALRHRVWIIVHDPVPIRPQFGYSKRSGKLARVTLRAVPRIRLISHTRLAANALLDESGCPSTVLPHPVARPVARPPLGEGPSTVRVLGQFKPSRALNELEEMAAQLASVEFEILGRGWPPVPGWRVDDTFLSEEAFDNAISTASCVVIPYSRFYQSGVATRCLERGVPIAGPFHEHLAQLYGADWPGLIPKESEWASAVLRAVDTDPETLARRACVTRETVSASWRLALERTPRDGQADGEAP